MPIHIPPGGKAIIVTGPPVLSVTALGAYAVAGNTISGTVSILPSDGGFVHWMLMQLNLTVSLGGSIASNSQIIYTGAANGVAVNETFSFVQNGAMIAYASSSLNMFTADVPLPPMPGLSVFGGLLPFIITTGSVAALTLNITVTPVNLVFAGLSSPTLYARRGN